MKGFTTRALHLDKNNRDYYGALRTPVYDSAAYEFNTSEEFSEVALGNISKHVYSRSTNPTVVDFENHLQSLTNAKSVMALGSGMAAITTAILTLVKAGDSIVTTKSLFGHTLSFFQKTLKNLGVNVKFVNVLDIDEVRDAIDSSVRLIFFESISNPQLEVVDIKAISQITKMNNIPLIVDTTMTPFYMFDAKKFGVNIEVLSSTKYISGGGTSVGGVILEYDNFDWKDTQNLKSYYEKVGSKAFNFKARKEVFQSFGATLSPHNAYLQTLGLETMMLRIDRACQNTKELALWLTTLSKIKNINYPMLESSPFYSIANEQFRYASSVLTFELSSQEEAFLFMNRLKIIKRATNIHDNKSLIVSPYHIIYPLNSHEEKMALKIPPYMLRLSVGIEDIEDIKEDILQAL